jgi:hypothetical protein
MLTADAVDEDRSPDPGVVGERDECLRIVAATTRP